MKFSRKLGKEEKAINREKLREDICRGPKVWGPPTQLAVFSLSPFPYKSRHLLPSNSRPLNLCKFNSSLKEEGGNGRLQKTLAVTFSVISLAVIFSHLPDKFSLAASSLTDLIFSTSHSQPRLVSDPAPSDPVFPIRPPPETFVGSPHSSFYLSHFLGTTRRVAYLPSLSLRSRLRARLLLRFLKSYLPSLEIIPVSVCGRDLHGKVLSRCVTC